MTVISLSAFITESNDDASTSNAPESDRNDEAGDNTDGVTSEGEKTTPSEMGREVSFD